MSPQLEDSTHIIPYITGRQNPGRHPLLPGLVSYYLELPWPNAMASEWSLDWHLVIYIKCWTLCLPGFFSEAFQRRISPKLKRKLNIYRYMYFMLKYWLTFEFYYLVCLLFVAITNATCTFENGFCGWKHRSGWSLVAKEIQDGVKSMSYRIHKL